MRGRNRTGNAVGHAAVGRARATWRAAAGAVAAAPLLLAACGGAPSTGGSASRPAAAAPAGTTVYRWGDVGNRGKIAGLERRTPTAVRGIRGTVVQVATSNSDGYALTGAGKVFAWGVGSAGELGDGTTVSASTTAVAVAFPPGVRIARLANPMPFDGALALDRDGRVWAWGFDGNHDLCLGGRTALRPQRLPLAHVTLVAGARAHTLVDAGGTVYACGAGAAGELGTGTTADASAPVRVVGLPGTSAVVALTASWEGSGALLADGAYYDWGYNAAGQVGDGTTADRALPVRVALPGRVVRVFQGGSGPANGQSVAVVADGSVWSWGNNERGQLGDGTRADSAVPVRVDVPSGVRFVAVTSGGYTSYAIDQHGRTWAWGGNEAGQLGTGGPPVGATRPVDIGAHLVQVSSTSRNVAGLGAPSG